MVFPEGLDPIAQLIGSIAFALILAYFAAKAHASGRAVPKPTVTEFAVNGQLADMGPVKELIEQAGLLYQQQVRTNIVLERTALALERAAEAYAGQIQAARDEAEFEAEVDRRLKKELDRERRVRRRVVKPTVGKASQ